MCIVFTKLFTILTQSVEFLIANMTCDSYILSQALYQDQSIVELVGDVMCSNNNSRGEK